MIAYEQYNGKFCLSFPAAAAVGISIDLFQKWIKEAKQYGYITRPGGNGRTSLIEVAAIPAKYKADIEAVYGAPVQVYHPLQTHFEIDVVARKYYDEQFRFEDGTELKDEQKAQYTLNASVLRAALLLLKTRENEWSRKGRSPRGAINTVVSDVKLFNSYLKLQGTGLTHTLPENDRKLRDKILAYAKAANPYLLLVDGRARNLNAAKVKAPEQENLLEELIGKHTGLDNVQICFMYNAIAQKLGWKTISPGTVANRRAESSLYTYSRTRGEGKFRDRKAMLVKRTAPTKPLYYWTLDGWDAELLYQKTEANDKGHNVTTYHNRLCIVIVLDPCNKIKYPVGYAIGTHETPELITQALRNAVNHTKELFGERYMPLQLQSDRYGNGALTPVYEAMSLKYTPARAKNAKAKVIEPYFNHINTKYCKLFDNWSGHGITSNPESQPNQDYLNKIRKQFPDEQGCIEQLERIIHWERNTKREAYLQAWNNTPAEDKHTLSTETYLKYFGETTGYTNKLQHTGLAPTINGVQVFFESFDLRLRECAHFDWLVKYDPMDLSQALAVNVKRKADKIEIIGSHSILLERQHEQPMALRDREEGDAEALSRINQFNKQLEQKVIERAAESRAVVEELFTRNPELNDTLAKMVLVDSNGQHKNQRNAKKAITKVETLPAHEDYEIVDDDVRIQY